METFNLVTIRNIDGKFYIHCYSDENMTLESVGKSHKPLQGDIFLFDATIDLDRPDYMISVKGNRRNWRLFNGITTCPEEISKEEVDWYLPWYTESSFFGKRWKKVLRGLAITKETISEDYEFLSHKTHCTILKHKVQ